MRIYRRQLCWLVDQCGCQKWTKLIHSDWMERTHDSRIVDQCDPIIVRCHTNTHTLFISLSLSLPLFLYLSHIFFAARMEWKYYCHLNFVQLNIQVERTHNKHTRWIGYIDWMRLIESCFWSWCVSLPLWRAINRPTHRHWHRRLVLFIFFVCLLFFFSSSLKPRDWKIGRMIR